MVESWWLTVRKVGIRKNRHLYSAALDVRINEGIWILEKMWLLCHVHGELEVRLEELLLRLYATGL